MLIPAAQSKNRHYANSAFVHSHHDKGCKTCWNHQAQLKRPKSATWSKIANSPSTPITLWALIERMWIKHLNVMLSVWPNPGSETIAWLHVMWRFHKIVTWTIRGLGLYLSKKQEGKKRMRTFPQVVICYFIIYIR